MVTSCTESKSKILPPVRFFVSLRTVIIVVGSIHEVPVSTV